MGRICKEQIGGRANVELLPRVERNLQHKLAIKLAQRIGHVENEHADGIPRVVEVGAANQRSGNGVEKLVLKYDQNRFCLPHIKLYVSA